MRRCHHCLMADTKPGVVLDDKNICRACNHAKRKATEIDWNKRWDELKELCDKHRSKDGSYDCIITGSGGKDSFFQTYVMKVLMKMNPLLLNVATNYSETEVGKKNFRNWSEAFGCDIISLHLNQRATRIMTRRAFEKIGNPDWLYDLAIYCWPIQMSIKLKIPLVIYGENVNVEYSGIQTNETPSALEQIRNGVILPIPWSEWFEGTDLTLKDVQPCIYPTDEEIEGAGVEPIYISYFFNWSGYKNYELAKRFGYQHLGHEWKREGYVEDYHQTDTIGYNLSGWMKYPKFGFQGVTDVVGQWLREKRISVEEGKKLIREKDPHLDQKMLNDFLLFTGYTHKEFWEVVDKWYNKSIFEQDRFGVWRVKDDGLDDVPSYPSFDICEHLMQKKGL